MLLRIFAGLRTLAAMALLLAATLAPFERATAGVGAHYDQAYLVYIPELGGPGGGRSSLVRCPTNQALTGFTFMLMPVTPTGPQGIAMEGICSTIDTKLGLGQVSITQLITGGARWPAQGYTRTCPAGHALSGWKIQHSRVSGVIVGMQAMCSELAVAVDRVTVGEPTVHGTIAGISADADETEASCPSGTIAGAFQGKTGEALDSLQMVCHPIRQQTLTVGFDVTPPPPSYDEFGVELADASGTVAIRAAGGTDHAQAVLTVGDYTVTPIPTGNYRVTGTTCTNPLTMAYGHSRGCRVALTEIVSANRSSITVTHDRQPADGSSAVMLNATVRGPTGLPLPGVLVTFSYTPGIRLGGNAVGYGSSCVTDASGSCSRGATGMAAGVYETQLVAAQKVLGRLRYTFVDAAPPGVSGRLFDDTGTGAGIANDGLANGRETGLAGAPVVLGDCAGIRHADTVTDATGRYRLVLPPGLAVGARLCVEAGRPTGRISTGGSVSGTVLPPGSTTEVAGVRYTYGQAETTDRIAFVLSSGQAAGGAADLDFGSVPPGRLASAGLQNGRPGSTATHPLSFTAGTAGRVAFSVSRSVATPALEGWTERLLADPGCSGRATADSVAIPSGAPQAVTAGQVVCLLLLQSVPVQALPGGVNETTVQASFTLDNTAPAARASWQLVNLTTASADTLELRKEVRNLSRNATAFGTSNQARPGELLEYRLTYSNTAAETVKGLVIHDTTPPYTSFVEATAGVMPAALGTCLKTTPASAAPVDCALAQPAGDRGAVGWRFTGELPPGASGSVAFRVRLD